LSTQKLFLIIGTYQKVFSSPHQKEKNEEKLKRDL
jgi:hypothetical protein